MVSSSGPTTKQSALRCDVKDVMEEILYWVLMPIWIPMVIIAFWNYEEDEE